VVDKYKWTKTMVLVYRAVLRIHYLHRVAGDSADRNDSEYSSPRSVRSSRASAGAPGVFSMAAASAVPWHDCTDETAASQASEHHRGIRFHV